MPCDNSICYLFFVLLLFQKRVLKNTGNDELTILFKSNPPPLFRLRQKNIALKVIFSPSFRLQSFYVKNTCIRADILLGILYLYLTTILLYDQNECKQILFIVKIIATFNNHNTVLKLFIDIL